jgi:hypothetical protein
VAIVGAHVLLYTREAERLRETLRDVLGWDSVEGHDPPDGWRRAAGVSNASWASVRKCHPKGRRAT